MKILSSLLFLTLLLTACDLNNEILEEMNEGREQIVSEMAVYNNGVEVYSIIVDQGSGTYEKELAIYNRGENTLILNGSPYVEVVSSEVCTFSISRQPSTTSLAQYDTTTFAIYTELYAMADCVGTFRIKSNDPEGSFDFTLNLEMVE